MGLGTGLQSFEQHAEQFSAATREAGRDEVFIAACLAYAHRLRSRGVPIIYDLEHLSLLVGYCTEYLNAAAYGGEKFYRTFRIPKKNGTFRQISEPLPSLKDIQRWILREILSRIPVSRYAKAFRPGLSLKANARFHVKQIAVLSLDFCDFFPSITRLRVFGVFRSCGYSRAVSDMLARLCCLADALPQGAPTSPALSNITCFRLDQRLGAYAILHGWRFTRYADDLTFSGDLRPGAIVRMVRQVAGDYALHLNPAKTRLMEQHQRQQVTGVVVNSKMQAPREVRRAIRQAVHYIRLYGIDSHLSRIEELRPNYLAHLLGLVAYIRHLNPKDEGTGRAAADLRALIRPGAEDG